MKPAPEWPLSDCVRTDYFTIKRTRSELGYTYWVLQGHGKFASFTLFDTWREALDEANTRLKNVSGLTNSLAYVLA